MTNKIRKKWLIRAIAVCRDCDWKEEDYNIAQKEARKHAIKTGHMVEVQTSYAQLYNSRYKKTIKQVEYKDMWNELYKKLDFLSGDARYKGAKLKMDEIKQRHLLK